MVVNGLLGKWVNGSTGQWVTGLMGKLKGVVVVFLIFLWSS